MAEIRLTTIVPDSGPPLPSNLSAAIVRKRIFGLGEAEVTVLKLCVGSDMIEIWPADPDHIAALADELYVCVGKLRDA